MSVKSKCSRDVCYFFAQVKRAKPTADVVHEMIEEADSALTHLCSLK